LGATSFNRKLAKATGQIIDKPLSSKSYTRPQKNIVASLSKVLMFEAFERE